MLNKKTCHVLYMVSIGFRHLTFTQGIFLAFNPKPQYSTGLERLALTEQGKKPQLKTPARPTYVEPAEPKYQEPNLNDYLIFDKNYKDMI